MSRQQPSIQLAGSDAPTPPRLGDRRDRDSLSLDMMEAARPVVDAYVLALLTQRTLSKEDFVGDRQGGCRLTPRIAGRLAETTLTWRHHVAPIAEQAAHTLAHYADGPVPLTTPLTGANRRAEQGQKAPSRQLRTKRGATPSLHVVCRDCGIHLSQRRHRYCDECRQAEALDRER